jgi:hypothetical protein
MDSINELRKLEQLIPPELEYEIQGDFFIMKLWGLRV